MLPQEAIQQFKELFKKRYGVELSDEEASFRANNLFSLYKVTYIGEPSIRNFNEKVEKSYELKTNLNK